MQTHVLKRIDELVSQGNATQRSQPQKDYWMRNLVTAQSWMSSAANAIQQVAPDGSFFRQELDVNPMKFQSSLWRNRMNAKTSSDGPVRPSPDIRPNISLCTDTQQQNAASQCLLRAGQL